VSLRRVSYRSVASRQRLAWPLRSAGLGVVWQRLSSLQVGPVEQQDFTSYSTRSRDECGQRLSRLDGTLKVAACRPSQEVAIVSSRLQFVTVSGRENSQRDIPRVMLNHRPTRGSLERLAVAPTTSCQVARHALPASDGRQHIEYRLSIGAARQYLTALGGSWGELVEYENMLVM
jgi:hypothetical protein